MNWPSRPRVVADENVLRQTILCALLLSLLAFPCGCLHRSAHRRQADAEAECLIRQKSCDPRWDSASGKVSVDASSRMFDPFCPDHSPLPPDDVASHRLMHCVDCKPGYPYWHDCGDTPYVQNPVWLASLPVNESGQVVLTLDRAYQLALLHSSDLQQQRETLYLSALDVSLERFGFDTQLFAGFNSFFTTTGRRRTGTGTAQTTLSNSLGVNGGGINWTRLGTTGASFTAGLANSIIWNFSGNNTQSANSLVNFSLIQPLLRDAGRERVLESLTQAERTLLANVRQLERFRRGFFLQVAIGRNIGNRLNRFGGYLAEPSPAPIQVGGFYGLIQQQQLIRNQEFNVRQLESVLNQFREFFLRERINAVQVKQFESTVYQQQQVLLTAKINYQNSLDQFKRQLGLPPDIEVVIDDPFLDRFELIDDQINDHLIAVNLLRDDTGLILNEISDQLSQLRNDNPQEDEPPQPGFEIELDDANDAEVEKIVRKEREESNESDANPEALPANLATLQLALKQAAELLEEVSTDDRAMLEADFEKLGAVREARLEYLAELQTAIEKGEILSEVEYRLFDAESVPLPESLTLELQDLDLDRGLLLTLEKISVELDAVIQATDPEGLPPEKFASEVWQDSLKESITRIPELLSDLSTTVLEMSLLQATARSNSIEVIPVRLGSDEAVEIARCFRRDWMNARAGLVDQWRQIEFFADQLDATVNLVFDGSLGNDGNNPFRLDYENGQLRGGLRFDAPIVRLLERNNYREALIRYQQARRVMYQFEDEVDRNLRQILRTIDRDKILFELNRRSVQVNIEQVELNRFALEEPVRPTAGASGAGRLGATTARDLIQAITGLNGSLNDFLRTWVEYEVLRMNLDFDLGTMQLDESFRWVDPGIVDSGIDEFAASMMGIANPCECVSTAGMTGNP